MGKNCKSKTNNMVCFLSDWRESAFLCEKHTAEVVTLEKQSHHIVRVFVAPGEYLRSHPVCEIAKYSTLEKDREDG
jgi:hypothetical protein